MIEGEALRYIWNSSSETQFTHKLDFFIAKLLKRGYEKSEVLQCLAGISYKRRNVYLEEVPKMSNKIPLFSARITSHKEVAQKLNKHSSGDGIIYQTTHLCINFSLPHHILALRWTQNLGECLIKAKIALNQNSNISLTPKLSNIENANSQTGTCPMSPTLRDFLALLDEN